MFKKIILCIFTLILVGTVAFADTMCECADSKGKVEVTTDGCTTTVKRVCLDCGNPKTIDIRATHTWVNGVCECGAICLHSDYVNGQCSACGKDEPGYTSCEHTGDTYTDSVLATCSAEGYIKTYCKDCKAFLNEETLPTNDDHAFLNGICRRCGLVEPCEHNMVLVKELAPSCIEAGYEWWECTKCGYEKNGEVGELADHNYGWVVITKPTPTADGSAEYKCSVCGRVADTKTVRYTKYYYNNTMCSFGPMTRELIGGNDWHRVTPVDTTVDGTYTYNLIASNLYVIGQVEIVVSNGVLIVDYHIDAGDVTIHDESLLLYGSKQDMKDNNAVAAQVGEAVDLAKTFGEDGMIIVSLILTGDYDAAHHKVKLVQINETVIKDMIELID